TSKMKKR
ncbi:toprim domain protein, partial [Vibrio parahaemolyticus V-223/04]